MAPTKNPNLESLVKRLIHEQLSHELPHTCFTCNYFTFKVEDGVEQEGRGNRGCRYTGNLAIKGGVCQLWTLQLDPRKRKSSFVSYYPNR